MFQEINFLTGRYGLLAVWNMHDNCLESTDIAGVNNVDNREIPKIGFMTFDPAGRQAAMDAVKYLRASAGLLDADDLSWPYISVHTDSQHPSAVFRSNMAAHFKQRYLGRTEDSGWLFLLVSIKDAADDELASELCKPFIDNGNRVIVIFLGQDKPFDMDTSRLANLSLAYFPLPTGQEDKFLDIFRALVFPNLFNGLTGCDQADIEFVLDNSGPSFVSSISYIDPENFAISLDEVLQHTNIFDGMRYFPNGVMLTLISAEQSRIQLQDWRNVSSLTMAHLDEGSPMMMTATPVVKISEKNAPQVYVVLSGINSHPKQLGKLFASGRST